MAPHNHPQRPNWFLRSSFCENQGAGSLLPKSAGPTAAGSLPGQSWEVPAEPTELAWQAEPTRPAEAAAPAEPPEPAEPAELAEPAEPAEPAELSWLSPRRPVKNDGQGHGQGAIELVFNF